MKKITIFSVLFFLNNIFLSLSVVPGYAILGGKKIPPPDDLVLVVHNQGTCSGSVLAPNVVITAAHCVHQLGGVSVFYRLGGGVETLIHAQDIAIHPKFIKTIRLHDENSVDLALIRTINPMPTRSVRRLASVPPKVGDIVEIMGFGRTTGAKGEEKNIYAMDKIDDFRSLDLIITRQKGESFLLQTDGNRGACIGDSGGPVYFQRRNAAVIVATQGKGEMMCGQNTMVVALAPYRDWIDSVLSRWNVIAYWD